MSKHTEEIVEVPGLVDLQVNGYNGVDFSSSDLTEQDFHRACRELYEAGTTAFLPTIVTSPRELYERNLPLIARCMQRPELQGRVLGIHIEGPFLSPVDGARGAHNADWIRKPDLDLLERMIEWADRQVRLLTIAAELPDAEQLTQCAAARGIAVSLGHQLATEADLERQVRAGASALTHLGNGIPSEIDRHHNPLWAGLANDNLKAMMIADGHHIPPALIKTIIRTKGPANCIIVSDASPLAGFKPGRYETMSQTVILNEAGRLQNPRTGYLAGSSATMLDCVNHLASLNLLDWPELLRMGFDNPLQLINAASKEVNTSNVRYDPTRKTFFTA